MNLGSGIARATTCTMSDSGLPPAYKLWERVESERNQRGWSTTELQERSGVDRATIYRWQKSKRLPLAETVNALADAFGIPRRELLTVAGLTVDSPAGSGDRGQATDPQPVMAIPDVEGDEATEELLGRLSPRRRQVLEEIRKSERQRLTRIVQEVAREADEANARFARLVRLEADEADIKEP
jgi:transcriptional regulator with XRE-family HTH domain